ncbi:phosphatase PAP2 family protein [Candidatus Micrarchaeota archaeon]|nr:phosphatase PAP2 family protein [Candidatus Micrarchaeota archaeon]
MPGVFQFVSLVLNNHYYPILIVLSFIALAFSKNRKALIISLILVTLLTPALKSYYQEERPCKTIPTIVDCRDFGFPSGHAITAVLLAASTLGTYAFFFFLPTAFTIAFSRIYLGVHDLNQLTGGISLGLFVYFMLERFHQSNFGLEIRRKKTVSEIGRQFFHLMGGFGVLLLLLFFSPTNEGILFTELAVIAALIIGLLLINLKMLKAKLGPIDYLLSKFERFGEFPGRGALLYVVGVLLLLSYSRDTSFLLGALAIFATGDAFSTIIGVKFGKHKLYWNKKKSLEGTFAFFASSSIAAYVFMGPIAIVYSAILALIESIDFQIDDNLLIPFCALILNLFLG